MKMRGSGEQAGNNTELEAGFGECLKNSFNCVANLTDFSLEADLPFSLLFDLVPRSVLSAEVISALGKAEQR